jgi:protein translocase SecG subunit
MGIITALATVLFVIVCAALVLAIIIQPGKGEGLSALTGMSQQMFGGGAMTFLAKVTSGLAIAYMVLVVLLAKLLQPTRIEVPETPVVETTRPPSSEPSSGPTTPATGTKPSTTKPANVATSSSTPAAKPSTTTPATATPTASKPTAPATAPTTTSPAGATTK